MTDKKLTDEEIISSLEVIATTCNCNECKIRSGKWGTCNCSETTANAALDLINRQKAAIERLRGSTIVSNSMESQRIKREAKTEAYKEFAEKLKLHSYIMSDESQTGIINRYSVVTVNQIDNILKELGGNER